MNNNNSDIWALILSSHFLCIIYYCAMNNITIDPEDNTIWLPTKGKYRRRMKDFELADRVWSWSLAEKERYASGLVKSIDRQEMGRILKSVLAGDLAL